MKVSQPETALEAYARVVELRRGQLLSAARICIKHGRPGKTRNARQSWRMGAMVVRKDFRSYSLSTTPRNRLGQDNVYGIHPNENYVSFLDDEVFPELRVLRQAVWAVMQGFLGDRDDHDCKPYPSASDARRTVPTWQRWYFPGYTEANAERDVRTCAARDWLAEQDWLTGRYETFFVDMTPSWGGPPMTHFAVSVA